MKSSGNKLVGYFFVIALAVAFAASTIKPILRAFSKKEEVELQHNYDTSEIYPFKGDDTPRRTYLSKPGILGVIDFVKEKFDFYTKDRYILQPGCLYITKYIDRNIIGLDMTLSASNGENIVGDYDDIVVRYKNDSLGFLIDTADISEQIKKVVEFGIKMKNEGRDFIYVMPPGKYAGNEIYNDYSEQVYEYITKALSEANLDILDIKQTVEELNLDICSIFFKTDHHWLPTTGIWADKLLAEYLNNNYGYSIDTSLFEQENYDVEVLENNFLGSQGKKVSTLFTKPDNFLIVTPKFETDFEVFTTHFNSTERGNIQQTLYDYSALENSLYERDSYGIYGYPDSELIRIHNNKAKDGKRVLFIKTSQANVMYPFFAAGVEYVDVIDIRYFRGSLQTFINETNPNTVVMVYGVLSCDNESTELGNFDFR